MTSNRGAERRDLTVTELAFFVIPGALTVAYWAATFA